jgi:LacI family transcriptional regulator
MSEKSPVSMKDLALSLGVDQSTVSLALSNSGKISAAMRKRVREAADKMGYRPNPLVAALMRNRRTRAKHSFQGVIAYLRFFPWEKAQEMGPIFSLFQKGAFSQADSLGFKCEDYFIKEATSLDRLTREFKAKGIRGILISPLANNFGGQLKIGSWEDFSTITIGPSLRNPRLHRVMSHHHENLLEAYKKCTEAGHRKIGLCFRKSTDERMQGLWKGAYLAAVSELPSRLKMPYLVAPEIEKSQFLDWISRYKPTAIIVSRPFLILEYLKEARISVPQDISVVTCSTGVPNGQVSGIVEDGFTIAAKAMNRLASSLYSNEFGVPAFPEDILIRGTWNHGETLAIQ